VFNSSNKKKSRDAPDIRPDNPAFFISGIWPDTRLPCRISGKANPKIYVFFLQLRKEKKFHKN
jgi:hypothetical protein